MVEADLISDKSFMLTSRLTWMLRGILMLFLSAAVFAGTAHGGLVNTAIYNSYSDNFPHGVNFTGSSIDNISTADFEQFGAATNWKWHPDNLTSFAADTLGYIQVPAAGSFTFILAGAQ